MKGRVLEARTLNGGELCSEGRTSLQESSLEGQNVSKFILSGGQWTLPLKIGPPAYQRLEQPREVSQCEFTKPNSWVWICLRENRKGSSRLSGQIHDTGDGQWHRTATQCRIKRSPHSRMEAQVRALSTGITSAR